MTTHRDIQIVARRSEGLGGVNQYRSTTRSEVMKLIFEMPEGEWAESILGIIDAALMNARLRTSPDLFPSTGRKLLDDIYEFLVDYERTH